MKKLNLFLVISMIFIAFLLIAGCAGNPAAPPIEEDFINITSVAPDSGLIDGVNTNFTVVVEYNLISHDTGLLMIGFNNGDEVGSYSMISNASHIVNKGSGKYTFNVNALTKNWGIQGNFSVYVNISEYPYPSTWTPLDIDIYALAFY